jgi:hypothetical protein
MTSMPLPSVPPDTLSSDPGADALRELARGWVADSTGRASVVHVSGSACDAIAALGAPRARAASVSAADALAWMAWTAASGGAHGRRRGMAYGRFAALWAVAALAGLEDEWPPSWESLGAAAGELRWWLWDADEPVTGWSLHLVIEDPGEGLAWAIAATDEA